MKRIVKNRLEWGVFGVSLVLVLATFGYLVMETVTARESPPDVVVGLGPPERGSAGYRVPVNAGNRGGRTAEDVRITVTLERSGAPAEASELVIPFLPRESHRRGWVTFRTDPAAGALRVSGIGYQDP